MVLNFGNQFFTTPDELKITEPSSAFWVSHLNAGAGKETIYTVPAAKVFYVSKVLAYSGASGYIDVNSVHTFLFQGAVETNWDFYSPIKFVAGTVIEWDPGGANDLIALVGWLGTK